ncbi:DoxX family protein [Nonomuraea ferruginea]
MKRVIFDVAALIARVVIGVIFVAHGLQKWTAGLGGPSAPASPRWACHCLRRRPPSRRSSRWSAGCC